MTNDVPFLVIQNIHTAQNEVAEKQLYSNLNYTTFE